MKTDHDGLPIPLEPTGGEAADSPLFADLIDAGPDEETRAVVADKGCSSEANRQAMNCRLTSYSTLVSHDHLAATT